MSGRFRRAVSRLPDALAASRVLADAGLVRVLPPSVVSRCALAVLRDGFSPAAALQCSAIRFPHAAAVVDDRGVLRFAELAQQVTDLAAALERAGIGRRDRVGVLCRNHREFVQATAAVAGLGADIVLLNVSMATPQLAGVLADEGATALVYDQEFAGPAREAARDLKRFVARGPQPEDGSEGGGVDDDPRLDRLDAGAGRRCRVARLHGTRYILLTSGTTGRPRGATRPVPLTIEPLVALLSRIPLRVRDVTLIASPLFHAWGFGNFGLAMVLSSTLILQDRFEPEATLAAVAEHRVRVLVAVPVMLQRLLELPDETRGKYDTSSLEVVASSGSALPGGLATRFMDAFGDVLYNVYGSTEAAWAGIATPEDLREAPASAGFPPLGTEVRIADDRGAALPRGSTGRVLVHNKLLVAGRADAGADGHQMVDRFLPTGDLGHLDDVGRLTVDGREDDMIVSGGENVYPQEIEDVLASHPAIAEVVVVGVPDAAYGERLRALVVARRGAQLSADEVRAFVRDRLARFKVPRDVEFVDMLPRNETGKVLRPGRPRA